MMYMLVGAVGYADDLPLLAPSLISHWSEKHSSLWEEFALEYHTILFNPTKCC